MNKKANTILFVLGATIINVIFMALIFTLLLVALSAVAAPVLSPEMGTLAVALTFLVTIVLTYLLYHQAVKYLSRKIDFEKYFEPIFRTRRSMPKRRRE